MSGEINYSKPIKECYKGDIEESRSHEKIDIVYEFIDDYSYEASTFCAIHVKKNKKDELEMYACMERGPQSKETLNKLVKWRVSGESKEKGHKGGGGCRFIYGHRSNKVSLCSILKDGEYIKLETYPDKIYDVAINDDRSESEFRAWLDTECIKWSTETLDLDEDDRWLSNYYNKIKEETGRTFNYIIRFILSEHPKEYVADDYWKYFISGIRMKNYKIDVYFRNELLGEKKFETYPNIDMIGFNNKVAGTDKHMELYVDEAGNGYISYEGQFLDSKGNNCIQSADFIHYANIICFLIDKSYLSEKLTQLNKICGGIRRYNQEDFHDPMIILNDKQINCLPMHNIIQREHKKGAYYSQQFRVTIYPICDDKYLHRFIVTDTVKSKTKFRDENKTRSCMKMVQHICTGAPPRCPKKKINPPQPKPSAKKHVGGYYLGYIGANVWKHGIVETINRLSERKKEHKKNSLEMIEEFTGIKLCEKNFTVYLEIKNINNVEVFEAKAKEIVSDYSEDKIIIYEAKTGSKDRECFRCMDHDYITQTIIPLIKQLKSNLE